MFESKIYDKDKFLLVELKGDLDIYAEDEFRSFIEKEIEPVDKDLLIDIKDLDYLDSTEMGFDIEQIEDLKVLVSEAINYKMGEEGLNLAFLVGDESLSLEVVGKDKNEDARAIAMRDAILSALADEIATEGDLLRITMRKTHA